MSLRRSVPATVALGALLGALVGLVLAQVVPAPWRATSVVELRADTGGEPLTARPAEVAAAAAAAELDAFAGDVSRAVPASGPVAGRLSARARGSGLLEITARGEDRTDAARLAGAAAREVLARRAAEQRDALLERVRALRAALPVAAPGDGASLARELRALRARAAAGLDVGRVAALPSAGDARRVHGPGRLVPAGLLVGAGAGLLLAVLRRRFARRARDADAIGEGLGRAPVALLPPRGGTPQERRRHEEALRGLRVAVERSGAGVVVVSSAAPAEGKTDVVVGLAGALARAGRRVVVVEADLRRPALAERLGVPPAAGDPAGLTTAIVGGVPVEGLLVEAAGGVRLLRRGAAVPNGPELLASTDVARVLRELRAACDVVLLDSAPLLPVADTSALLGVEDVELLLLVARSGRVRRDELRRLRALLPELRPAVRLVVNDEPSAGRRYDAYLAAVDDA